MSNDPILVTGVGKRAGLHLARHFLDRGRAVIGTYRSHHAPLDELRARGAELHACDFQQRADVEALIAAITSRHRRLRAIIHNASDWISDDSDVPSSEIIERMMRVHASVPYELNQALTPLLLACTAPHADIVHIGDFVSSHGSRKHIAYAASKAAQDNLTLSFAAKLAPKVKVNSLAPALLLFNEHDGDEYRERTLAKSLMRREGGFDELQNAIEYLFSSRYVTGRILPLDGGRHLV